MNVRPVGVGVLGAPTATVQGPTECPDLSRLSRRALVLTLMEYGLCAVCTLSLPSVIQPVAPLGRLGSRTRCQPGLVSTTGTHVGLPSSLSGRVATGGPPAVAETGTAWVGWATVPSAAASASWGMFFSVANVVARGSLPDAGAPAADDADGGWCGLFPPQPVTRVAMVAATAAPTVKRREPPARESDGTERPRRARVERVLTKTPKITGNGN